MVTPMACAQCGTRAHELTPSALGFLDEQE